MNRTTKTPFPHSFGVFSPTGYVLMVFSSDTNAEKARQALLEHGYREDDITRYDRSEVQAEFAKSQEHAIDPTQIGQEVEKVDKYIEFAKKGSGFLVVHAPEDEISKRAVRIVKPFQLQFAEKYNRLTLEELA